MTKSEIHARFLQDHAKLRGKSSVLQSLALGVLRGDEDLATAMKMKSLDLQGHLIDHVRREVKFLFPLLGKAGDTGIAAASCLNSDHRRHRQRLADLLIEDGSVIGDWAAPLAKHLLELIERLEADMACEEAMVREALGETDNQPRVGGPSTPRSAS